MAVTALAPWYGSNRMLAEHVGTQLTGCNWVGIPFAGGCCEIGHIKARTIVASDKHRHLINLARVVADPKLCEELRRLLGGTLFHPDTLADAQGFCRLVETENPDEQSGYGSSHWAAAYFITCWMARNGIAGTKGEFKAGLSVRWNAAGGDSVVRWQSAIAGLDEWHKQFRGRCTFVCEDAFAFLGKVKDQAGHGIYCDPPFPGAGDLYRHDAGKGENAAIWHTKLASTLTCFNKTRVVVRYYDVPLIQDLYTERDWRRVCLTGRAQTNGSRPELLLVRN